MPKPKPEIGASEVYLAIGKGCYGFSVDTALVSGLVTSADGLQLHGSCHDFSCTSMHGTDHMVTFSVWHGTCRLGRSRSLPPACVLIPNGFGWCAMPSYTTCLEMRLIDLRGLRHAHSNIRAQVSHLWSYEGFAEDG